MIKQNEISRTIEDLIKEERIAYFKKWRNLNKDKVKKYNYRYWEKRVRQKGISPTPCNYMKCGDDVDV